LIFCGQAQTCTKETTGKEVDRENLLVRNQINLFSREICGAGARHNACLKMSKFLTENTPGHALVDSLPYHDHYDENLKVSLEIALSTRYAVFKQLQFCCQKQISYLIEKEMQTFQPRDYLAPLGLCC
jgi:hypothetical protein